MSQRNSRRWTPALLAALLFVSPALAGENPGTVVDRFFDAYREGSVEKMLALYTTDAVFEDVNQRHRFEGAAQLEAMLTAIVGMHLRMDLVEQRRVATDDTVVVEYEYQGQLNGHALGQQAGRVGCPDLEYILPVTSWYRIDKGKITSQKDFIDWATFLDLREEMLAAGTPAP